jgi:hypothetical protein
LREGDLSDMRSRTCSYLCNVSLEFTFANINLRTWKAWSWVQSTSMICFSAATASFIFHKMFHGWPTRTHTQRTLEKIYWDWERQEILLYGNVPVDIIKHATFIHISLAHTVIIGYGHSFLMLVFVDFIDFRKLIH